MKWFRRRREQAAAEAQLDQQWEAVKHHLERFLASRRGIEAWIEEPTTFNKPSILLVAADGESTRRSIPSVEDGYDFAADHGLPVYDAGVVPYPRRMREYGLRQRKAR